MVSIRLHPVVSSLAGLLQRTYADIRTRQTAAAVWKLLRFGIFEVPHVHLLQLQGFGNPLVNFSC